jgi:hypothetical protein
MTPGIILIVGLTSVPMASMDACTKAADELGGVCIDQSSGDVVKSKGFVKALRGGKALDTSGVRDFLKQELGRQLNPE